MRILGVEVCPTGGAFCRATDTTFTLLVIDDVPAAIGLDPHEGILSNNTVESREMTASVSSTPTNQANKESTLVSYFVVASMCTWGLWCNNCSFVASEILPPVVGNRNTQMLSVRWFGVVAVDSTVDDNNGAVWEDHCRGVR